MAWKCSYAPVSSQYGSGKKFLTLAGTVGPGDPGRGPSEIQIDNRVVKSVSTWLTSSPPMMQMPSGFSQFGPYAAAKRERNGAEQRAMVGHP